MSASKFSIYNAIIKPLRDADQTELLKRYLKGPQAIHDQAEASILTLPDQVKADKVRDDLLQYLMPLVGFTSELRNITDRLSTAQLRRLVALAVPLWNQRHTKAGLINAIRLLTGRAAVFSDWFFYRAMLSETSLMDDMLATGHFWVIGGSVSTYDEYVSNIRLMDDGALDEVLLLDVCKLMRPLDERFEVFLDDFLDNFDTVLDKWVNTDGDPVGDHGAISTTNPGTLELFAGKSLQPIIPILPASTDHHDYNVVCKFNIPANGVLVVRWYTTATANGTAYELTLDAATGRGTLRRWIAGVATVIQAAANWPSSLVFSPGVWYSLRISTVNVNSTTRALRILIDGCQAVPYTSDSELIDAPGASPSSGFYLFKNTGATPVWIDNVESWRNPARFATIGLSTIAERGGAVTMSPNFIL